MSHFQYRPFSRRIGFSLIEIIIVLVMMAVIMRMALPRLNTGTYRADAAAQQVRSVFQTAQRTSLTRQYDVIVSVDTTQFALRIAEDANNDGTIESNEWKFWRPAGEGNTFSIPPKGLNAPTVTTSIVGQNVKSIGNLPSVTFHRDGSTSTDMEIYIQTNYKKRIDWRLIALTRSTGRAEIYRLSGTGSSAVWQVIQ